MVLSVLISAKVDHQFKVPNLEVMADWARWVVCDITPWDNILKTCVEGPVSDFVAMWPNVMHQVLHPRLVAKHRKAWSHKTPENFYLVHFIGLMHSLGAKGWEVSVEAQAGTSYVDIRLLQKQKREAVLIELKSSEKKNDVRKDADEAFEQIVDSRYRNPKGLSNIETLRKYGIAFYHLHSYVKGQYLKLNVQGQWVEEEDPAMSVPWNIVHDESHEIHFRGAHTLATEVSETE